MKKCIIRSIFYKDRELSPSKDISKKDVNEYINNFLGTNKNYFKEPITLEFLRERGVRYTFGHLKKEDFIYAVYACIKEYFLQ